MIGKRGSGLIFLLGLPRAGTTLLAELIGNDPEISAPPEPWIMFSALAAGDVDSRHPAGSQAVGVAARQFLGNSNLKRLRRNFAVEAYNAWLRKEKRAYFLDKTPRYYQIVEQIAELLPEARFILLRRNLLDVALSYRDSWGIDFKSLAETLPDDPALFDLVLGPGKLEAFLSQYRQRIHVMHYEALVDDPLTELVNVFAAFGLSRRREEIASRLELSHRLRGGRDMGDRKILATKSVHNNSKDGWKKLSDADLFCLIGLFGAELLETSGYGVVLEAVRQRAIALPQAQHTAILRTKVAEIFSSRWSDMARNNGEGLPLSSGEQQDIGFILSASPAYVESGLRGRLKHFMIEREQKIAEISRLNEQLALLAGDHEQRGRAVAMLESQLLESEADRAARGKALSELERQLREAEADRMARGKALSELERQLQEAEADRVARGEAQTRLEKLLIESEQDRAARGQNLEILQTLLNEAEADRAARGDAIKQLTAWLKQARGEIDG